MTETPDFNLVTWDWKEQPPWDEINRILEGFDVVIEEVDTESDDYGIRIKQIVHS